LADRFYWMIDINVTVEFIAVTCERWMLIKKDRLTLLSDERSNPKFDCRPLRTGAEPAYGGTQSAFS
jgi:hypothetical protein